MDKLNHLKLLSKQYPNIDAVSTEIINLSSILNLPKGTEHFLTDLHGEYEAFSHVIRNASGVVKRKIEETFEDTLTKDEKERLASLVYYPKEKLIYLERQGVIDDAWYEKTIYQIVLLFRKASFKYTRSKVKKALPDRFKYVIEELIQEQETSEAKKDYYYAIIGNIIKTERADAFIIEMCDTIRKLVVDRLHIIGDIYDRGAGAHLIMDDLMKHHSVDIQWGNHDILWMGAAAGSKLCILNALRIALRYGSLETIQDGYGVNLLPLAQLASDLYLEDPHTHFKPKLLDDHLLKERDIKLIAKMHKTIAIIQFKLEGQTIKKRPELDMEDRLLLEKLSSDKKAITIDGKAYMITDSNLPTVDMADPYKLTEAEEDVITNLVSSFIHSEKLNNHVQFLYAKGRLYNTYNGNLLYHGCIPFNEDGTFMELELKGKKYSGKKLFDYFDKKVREAYFETDESKKEYALDMMWYVWCGKKSPLFGKDKMATFERTFLKEKPLHEEEKNNYYTFRNDVAMCEKILAEFELNPDTGRIINGHIPVKASEGESPVKADGKMIVIDGGFSRAYQKITGIAGYTLTYNSQCMILVSHEPFDAHENSIYKNTDMLPNEVYAKHEKNRILVGDTDAGKELKGIIKILNDLLEAYRNGDVQPRV